MRVQWTETAIRHLLAIYEWIGNDSPHYAAQTVDRLTRRSERNAASPEAGRLVPEYESSEIREWIEHPYRIIYRTQGDQIDILAVIHGARELPPIREIE